MLNRELTGDTYFISFPVVLRILVLESPLSPLPEDNHVEENVSQLVEPSSSYKSWCKVKPT